MRGGAERADRRWAAPVSRLGPPGAGPADDHPNLHRPRRGAKGGLPRDRAQLDRLLSRGLTATAPLWPDIPLAYGWGHHAAPLLANHQEQAADGVRGQYDGLLAEMDRRQAAAGTLAPAIGHCLTVTRRSRPGLFHCSAVADLPRTNNDLEHLVGSARHHERRTTGRTTASPALVVRGSVRVVAAVATRQSVFSAADLAPSDLERWRERRHALDYRHEARRAQRRFRRDPRAYLAGLEAQLAMPGLPA